MKKKKDNRRPARAAPVRKRAPEDWPELCARRNRFLEQAEIDHYPMRFPRLYLRAHFHYGLMLAPGFSVGGHGHHHWEISRVARGAARYRMEGGEEFEPSPAEFLLLPARAVHSMSFCRAPLLVHSWQVVMEPEGVEGERIADELRQRVAETGFRLRASRAQVQAERHIWRMTGAPGSPRLAGPVLSGFARIVVGELLLRLNPWSIEPPGVEREPRAERRDLADRLRLFLDEHLVRPPGPEEMETLFHYSVRHLNRIFRDAFGDSIGRYVRNQRFELAKNWLVTTARPIKDIAASLGYGSPGLFGRDFLQRAGLTPAAFRRQAATGREIRVRKSIKPPVADRAPGKTEPRPRLPSRGRGRA